MIEKITNHLNTDNGYKMVAFRTNITFDISNTIPEKAFSPYFEIVSIEQAKKILKEVLYLQNNYKIKSEFEEMFINIIKTKSFDISNPIYFSVFHPDRI